MEKEDERIELEGVPQREKVQIHIGNFQADTIGCLLPGTGVSSDFSSVTNSAKAMEILRDSLRKFEEKIRQSALIEVEIRD